MMPRKVFSQTLVIAVLVAAICCTACRRKRSVAGSSPQSEESPATPAAAAAAPVASQLADASAAATPLPPPNAEITVAVERRFIPAQQMNAYSPAQPGDYQAQLNLYNRVLRKRVEDLGNTPDTFEQLMASSGYPKPPQPPAGRRLVYDRGTVTVSLQ